MTILAIPLLKVGDVARLLGVSKATIYKLSASGDLPSSKVASGAIRFAPGDVETYLHRR